MAPATPRMPVPPPELAPNRGPEASPDEVSAKAPTQPVEIVAQLFAALRTADNDALHKLVRFPFELRDTGSEGECKSGSAKDADQLRDLLQCLYADTLLTGDLKEHPLLLIEQVVKNELPPWTKKWRNEIHPDDTLLHVMVPGNGNTFHFIVLASVDRAHALWKETTFEGN